MLLNCLYCKCRFRNKNLVSKFAARGKEITYIPLVGPLGFHVCLAELAGKDDLK
jgi:hypothetical protein